MVRTATDLGSDSRAWLNQDGTYHIRYATFVDANESYPNWHLVYILVYPAHGKSGWIYKLYVHRKQHAVDIGEVGTTLENSRGNMEIDDVWGGLATHKTITSHLRVLQSAPLARISREQVRMSGFSCYDYKNPFPDEKQPPAK